ncbi:MAG: hypothetical protein HQM08_01040 [Candidatus Riflebacteria bacterium]|nr:hypothetical protein [Candidatus Riflebacteria bacterium]
MIKKNLIFGVAVISLAGLSLAFSYRAPVSKTCDEKMAGVETTVSAPAKVEDNEFGDEAFFSDKEESKCVEEKAGGVKSSEVNCVEASTSEVKSADGVKSAEEVKTAEVVAEASQPEAEKTNKSEAFKESSNTSAAVTAAAPASPKENKTIIEEIGEKRPAVANVTPNANLNENKKQKENTVNSEKKAGKLSSKTDKNEKASKAKNGTSEAIQTAKATKTTKASNSENTKKLFAYTRLLNFTPHPQSEEFLKDKPLMLNGKKYHFAVSYNEEWEAIDDDSADLKSLGFDIDVYENGKKIRNLKLPKVSLSPNNLRKGQVLGLAEVAPYNFKIELKDFKAQQKGVAQVLFNVELSS